AKIVANDPAHRTLAREAAVKGIVLLKNDNQMVPLDAHAIKTIALIGPNADQGQLGDYSGRPDHVVTPLEGVRAALAQSQVKVLHATGCEILSTAMVGARFSVRCSGSLKVDLNDTYTLHAESNDGVR